MCSICKTALKSNKKKLLDDIAKEIKKGVPAEHFEEVLNEVLENNMSPRDENLENDWSSWIQNSD